MPAIDGAQEGKGLGSTKLTQQDPVRAQAQRGRQQGVHIDPRFAEVAADGDQANTIGVVQADFRGVLDHDQPL